MKKFFLLAILTLPFFAANAQDYKPFQSYIRLGYAAPSDGGGGVLVNLEPAYRINDQIGVGLRIESAVMGKVVDDTEADLSGVVSYTLNGKYYLKDDGFRPYVGLGLGIYALGNISATTGTTSSEISAGSAFGFYPRIGFDAGHFNFNLDYNIIPTTDLEIDTNTTTDVKNSYIGVSIGVFVFGGKN